MSTGVLMGPLIASTYRRFFMTRQTMQSQWRQLKPRVQEFWGRITLDEVEQLDGSFDGLAAKVQEKYKLTPEQAERQVNEFLARCEAERRPPFGAPDPDADPELQH